MPPLAEANSRPARWPLHPTSGLGATSSTTSRYQSAQRDPTACDMDAKCTALSHKDSSDPSSSGALIASSQRRTGPHPAAGRRKRAVEHAGMGAENVHNVRPKSPNEPFATAGTHPSTKIGMSRSSSSGGGSNATRHSTAQRARPSRSNGSLSNRHRSRSRNRAQQRHGAAPNSTSIVVDPRHLPAPPSLLRCASTTSSCPEPRGATLSITTTSQPVMAVVLAEGQLELAGTAQAVLEELRCGRSVPNSEHGGDDEDRDSTYQSFAELTSTMLLHDCTAPLALPDLPTTPPSPTRIQPHPSSSTASPPSGNVYDSAASPLHRCPSASRSRISPSTFPTAPPVPADCDAAKPTTGADIKRSKSHPRSHSRKPSQHSLMSVASMALSSVQPSVATTTVATAAIGAETFSQRRTRSQSHSKATDQEPSVSRSAHAAVVATASATPAIDECRRRDTVNQDSTSGSIPTVSATPTRPTLYSYTSFESTFGVEAPRTPEDSPVVRSGGASKWWSRSS